MARFLLVPSAVVLLACTAASAQSVEQLMAEGGSLVAQERYSKAIDAYSRAIAARPSAETYAARARAWYAMDRAILQHSIKLLILNLAITRVIN